MAANTNVTGKPPTQLGAAVSAPAAVRINQTGVREAAAHPFTPARTGIPHTATTQAATAATGRVLAPACKPCLTARVIWELMSRLWVPLSKAQHRLS